MVAIGVLLLVSSGIFLILSTVAFGDIGISMLFAGITALLCGIGFLVTNSKIKRMASKKED